MAVAQNASAAVPAWTNKTVEEVVPPLLAGLGLEDMPRITMRWERGDLPKGVRIVESQVHGDEVLVTMTGAWRRYSPEARSQLVRNLAHELAHVWQWSLGDPYEPLLLHEGFAEAIAVNILARCRDVCRASPERLVMTLEDQCRHALQKGRVGSLQDRDAIYGCGGVLADSMSVAAQMTPQDFYQRLTETERTMGDFLAIAEQFAGRHFALSARTFLTADLRLASASTTMARLRAGRL